MKLGQSGTWAGRIFSGLMMVLLFGAWEKVEGQTAVLSPKLRVGSEYVTYSESDVKMGLPVGGASGEQTVRTEQQVTMTVRQGADGESKVVSLVFDFATLELKSPMMNMSYDSRRPDQDDSGFGGNLSAMVGKEIQLIYDANDEFVRVEGGDLLTDDGSSSPFGQSLGVNELRAMVRSTLGAQLGTRKVTLGESWQHVMDLAMPGVGDVGLDLRFLYRKDGSVEGVNCAIIDFNGMIAGEVMTDEAEATRDDARAEGRADEVLSDSRVTGTVAYDKELGVPRATDMEMRMVMMMHSPLGAESEVKIPILQKSMSVLRSFRALGRAPASAAEKKAEGEDGAGEGTSEGGE
ncbi:MAG: hypothetical protein AAF591_19555 [Verrucomicrobiota bacterium]